MKLSLLICSLHERHEQLKALQLSIVKQDPKRNDIEMCTLIDNGEMSVGEKRNELIRMAKGDYVAFIDDDDRISKDYIEEVLKGINDNVDCCSLVGEITTNGTNPKLFVHSIKYDHYFESEGVYYRPPNHLNVIKKELITEFRFPDTDYGEDTNWAIQIANSQILKKEYEIKKIIYHYDYRTRK